MKRSRGGTTVYFFGFFLNVFHNFKNMTESDRLLFVSINGTSRNFFIGQSKVF